MKFAFKWFCASLAAALVLTACSPTPEPETLAADGRGSKLERSSTRTPESSASCVETDPHPIGQSIADKYDVEYERVMDWFCAGESFDDILLALETHRLTDLPVEQLLDRANEVGWEQLWDEEGVVETPDMGDGP